MIFFSDFSTAAAGAQSNVVNTRTAFVDTGTTMNITMPTASVGDILLVGVTLDGVVSDNLNPTVTGCRRLYRFPSSGSTGPFYIFARQVDGLEGGTLTIGWTDSGFASAVAVTVTDAMHLDFATKNNAISATPASTAGTTVDNNELLLAFVGHLNSSRTLTTPSGMTLEATVATTSSSLGSRTALASAVQATAGATSTYPWTLSGSSPWANLLLGIANERTPAASSGITFVGGKTFNDVGAGNTEETLYSLNGLTGGSDTRIQPGDLIIFAQEVSNTTASIETALQVAGFTQAAYIVGLDTMNTHLSVQYRIADKADGTIRLNGSQNSSSSIAAAVMVFRGVNQSTPLDVAVTTAIGANTGLANPPAITPVTSGAMIVAIGAGGYTTNPALTSPDLTGFITSIADDTWDSNLGIGYHAWLGGSFDPGQFGGGNTNTNASWAAVTMALRPA